MIAICLKADEPNYYISLLDKQIQSIQVLGKIEIEGLGLIIKTKLRTAS